MIVKIKYDKEGAMSKCKVKVHKQDLWSLDHTLCHVILPCLIKLKETKHGSPYVENSDRPESLRDDLSDIENMSDEYYDLLHKSWDYVMDEMIFAFSEKLSEFDDFKNSPKWIEKQKRIANGFRLFGVYYQGLWN